MRYFITNDKPFALRHHSELNKKQGRARKQERIDDILAKLAVISIVPLLILAVKWFIEDCTGPRIRRRLKK